MPDNLSEKLKIETAFKAALGVVDSDPDKSFFEETQSHIDFITGGDVAIDPIPFDRPDLGIVSGVVASGLVTFYPDPTVGGGYRGFTTSGAVMNFLAPQKFGNSYAPIFYHSSGAVLIVDGDFYENAVFDFKEAYITVQRNFLTDAWVSPLVVDGFWYTGRFLSGNIVTSTISGNVSLDNLVLAQDLSLVFDTNLELVVD